MMKRIDGICSDHITNKADQRQPNQEKSKYIPHHSENKTLGIHLLYCNIFS